MTVYEIELVEVGRKKHSSKLVWSAATLAIAESKAIDEASKHLMSSEISLEEKGAKGKSIWYRVVVGGYRVVGEVIIKELQHE